MSRQSPASPRQVIDMMEGRTRRGRIGTITTRGERARLSYPQSHCRNIGGSFARFLRLSTKSRERRYPRSEFGQTVSSPCARPLRLPVCPEAFLQVSSWRITQESVVAAMPVLLDSGYINGISSVPPCLVAYEDKALALRRPLSLLRLQWHGGGFEGSFIDLPVAR
jgi:hypothetical protein